MAYSDYEILSDTDTAGLAAKVRAKIREKWEPEGSMVAYDGAFFQPMAKFDTEDETGISIRWTIDDVRTQCSALDDDEAMEVLIYIERHHDATIGVNCDVIDSAIEHLYPEKHGTEGEDDEDEEDEK